MPNEHEQNNGGGLLDRVSLRAVGLDDWSDVRYVHVRALERLAGLHLDAEETAAIKDYVATPEYTDEIQRESLHAAWLDGHLIGTAGWGPADDTGISARVTSAFVDPMFARLGVGRLLVVNAEERARAAGFRIFTTRTTSNAVGFFEALGYEISSYGVCSIAADRGIPVTFLKKRDAIHATIPTPTPAKADPVTVPLAGGGALPEGTESAPGDRALVAPRDR